ncbi:MAG: hypothetical protein ABEJ61_06330 [Haloferacaceae archaeon]
MVGPSLSDDERRSANLRLKLGFVALVAASGGLVALQAGGSPRAIAGGALAGLAAGLFLLVVLVRLAGDFRAR